MSGSYKPHGGGRGNPPPRKPDLLAFMTSGLEETMAAIEVATGENRETLVIAPEVTFRQWCEDLGAKGLKVDGKPFRLDDRPAMAWVYDQVPSSIDEAYRYMLVIMKCAQVGFTVMEMLATIYLGLKFGRQLGQCTIGMFLPDMNLAGVKSTERFMPVVRSVPEVHALMTQDAADGSGRKQGEGNVNRRRIDSALFIFSWTSGRATTESIPMDVLSFDEVQEMTLDQIEKTIERLSASPLRTLQMGSTANWPDADIDHWYKRGTRFRFHTRCRTCGSSKPLDDYFPECIRLDKERDTYRYVCPNGHWIDDSQDGEWIAEHPERDPGPQLDVPLKDRKLRIRSVHFPQFLSPTISPEEILSAYNTATDMKNFFNRKLGKPYLDPSQVPVTLEHLARCVEAGKALGVRWKTRGKGCYMGIDQMGNFNVVVIKERLPDGRQATVHVEMIYSADPFARCDELMEAFGVAVCVVEINPNYNDAKRFANRHRGRVFICDSFGRMAEGMIAWGDAPKLDVSERRTDEAERDRYTLKMDQYKCMQVSMARFTAKEPLCVFPDPQGLVQEVKEKGIAQTAAVLPIAFTHFTKTALVAEKDEETNQFKRSVKKIGIDPHFSYANMLCDVAWARSHGTATFLIPEAEVVSMEPADQLRRAGMPETVAQMVEAQSQGLGDTCGQCAAGYDEEGVWTGRCAERHFMIKPDQVACVLFMAK
jgi:hypothetical protein